MAFVMSSLHGSLDKNINRGIWNFKMAAIFQDGQHLSEAFKWYNGLLAATRMEIGMGILCGSLDNKPPTAIWNVKVADIFFRMTPDIWLGKKVK